MLRLILDRRLLALTRTAVAREYLRAVRNRCSREVSKTAKFGVVIDLATSRPGRECHAFPENDNDNLCTRTPSRNGHAGSIVFAVSGYEDRITILRSVARLRPNGCKKLPKLLDERSASRTLPFGPRHATTSQLRGAGLHLLKRWHQNELRVSISGFVVLLGHSLPESAPSMCMQAIAGACACLAGQGFMQLKQSIARLVPRCSIGAMLRTSRATGFAGPGNRHISLAACWR